MKILAFADLHVNNKEDSIQMLKAREIVSKEKPDLVLIAGDVFETTLWINPYKELSKLERPVIFCLGNHEFVGRTVTDTLDFYKSKYLPNLFDVHCLDVVGSKKINDLNFVGNVLWYDGSLSDVPGQSQTKINSHWLDSMILDFDFKEENKKCLSQIKENYDDNLTNVLLTHTVPHRKLNVWSNEGPGWPNMYSGMEDILKDFDFEWAVCGHTHRFTKQEIYQTHTVNVGNDYMRRTTDPLKFYIFEI